MIHYEDTLKLVLFYFWCFILYLFICITIMTKYKNAQIYNIMNIIKSNYAYKIHIFILWVKICHSLQVSSKRNSIVRTNNFPFTVNSMTSLISLYKDNLSLTWEWFFNIRHREKRTCQRTNTVFRYITYQWRRKIAVFRVFRHFD